MHCWCVTDHTSGPACLTWRMTERMRALTGPVKDSVTPAPWKHHNTIPPLLKMAKKSSISAKHRWTRNYEEQNKHLRLKKRVKNKYELRGPTGLMEIMCVVLTAVPAFKIHDQTRQCHYEELRKCRNFRSVEIPPCHVIGGGIRCPKIF